MSKVHKKGLLGDHKSCQLSNLGLGERRALQDASMGMRILSCAMILAASAGATTLQQLSLDDMIRQSTAIVHAKVTGSYSAFAGRTIYTHYQLQIEENLAGTLATTEAVVPGGAAKGLRQMAAGAPTLVAGQDYVLFLWTSKSGLNQVMGLSQGLFNVMQDSSGNAVLVRPAANAPMLNKSGNVVNDSSVTMKLSDLKTEIQKVMGAGK